MERITKIESTRNFLKARKIRVAAYARVSTQSEEQLLSLETQKEHYNSLISSNPEWEYVGLYYDEGISATKIEKRDGLLALLNDCRNGMIDKVITKSISRFSRSTIDCLEMVRELSKLNVFLFFEKENIDTEHMSSELMLSILSSIAEGESRSISENNKWSVKHRFEMGTFIISCPPYGYANIDGKMVIVQEEAKIVKEIFAMSISGKGSYVIAKELNTRGIPSRKGSQWHSSTIEGILKNEKYTGDAIFQKTYTDESYNRHINYGEKNKYLCKNHHEAIISHEDFDKAAEIMTQRAKEKGIDSGTVKYQNRYSFSGKIICGECGATFKRRKHYNPNGNYIAWCCNRHIVDKTACSMLFIRDESIKKAFVRLMRKLQMTHKQILRPFIVGLRKINSKSNLHQILKFEKLIEQNEEQQTTLVSLMSSGYIEAEVYHVRKNALLIEKDRLSKEKQSVSKQVNGNLAHLNEAQKLLNFAEKAILTETFDDKLFLDFIDGITVKSRSELIFHLKCGLDLTERLM